MTPELIYVAVVSVLALLTFLMFPATGLLIAITSAIYAVQTNFDKFTVWHLTAFLAIGLFTTFLEDIFTLIGAKKFGASKFGIIGAMVGLSGVFLMPGLGVFLGPLIGAFLGELFFAKKTVMESVRASSGAILGMFTGTLAKGFVTMGLALWFALTVLR